jgi:REP element-mobilizing transposase RayT
MERYRFHPEGSVFFVTFSVVEWLPVFVSEAASGIIADSCNYCHRHKGLRTNAYVIMPTHLHAIFFHESFTAAPLVAALTDFRKFTGRRLSDFCAKQMPTCFSDVFRKSAGQDRERCFWQPSRHPELIESESFWRQKLDYLHDNPCRKGLVRRAVSWRFSSAGHWLAEREVANDVILTAIDW